MRWINFKNLFMLGLAVVSNTGCFLNSSIRGMDTPPSSFESTTPSPSIPIGQPTVTVVSPAVDGLTTNAYKVFAGTCTPNVSVDIAYPANTSGPSSTPCTASGTFAVGIKLSGSNSSRSLSFSQTGGPATLRTINYSLSGINVAAGFDSYVYALAYDSVTQQIYVGGQFIYNGQTSLNGIARINADGTLDKTFVSEGGGFVGVTLSPVYALAWDGAAKQLYVGGAFTSFIGSSGVTTQNYISRLNQNGSLDTSFMANGEGLNGTVQSLAWDSATQKIYVGGGFSSHTKNGITTIQERITRLNSDGTVDTGFMPAGAGFDSQVNALVWDSSANKIYVGGSFSNFTNGATTAQLSISRINANGSVDTGFIPAGAGYDWPVYSLALDPVTHHVYVGGAYSDYTNGTTTAQEGLSRLSSTGVLDTTFMPSGAGVNVRVNAMIWDGGAQKLYIGGQYTSFTNGATVTQNYISRINSNGTLDTTFSSATTGGGMGYIVWAMAWDSVTQKLYVGGGFRSFTDGAGTTTALNFFGRFSTATGLVDPSYSQPSSIGGFNGYPKALAWDPVTRKLYAGGPFTSYSNGSTITNQYNIARINPDGTLDTGFIPAGGGFNGIVNALVWDPVAQKLYVGGSFTSFTDGSGTTIQNRIARLNSNGSLDTSFIPPGAGFNNAVNALAWDSVAMKIYAAGAFTTYTNGATTTQLRAARLSSSGVLETSFVPAGAGFNQAVNAVAWDSISSKLYLAGQFTSYTNGTTTTQNYLTRLDSSGVVDTGFVSSGGGLSHLAYALIWDETASKVYVGGSFNSYTVASTTTSQPGVVRLNPNGTVDTSFFPAGTGIVGNAVYSLTLDSTTGQLYVGGWFFGYTNGTLVSQKGLSRINSNGTLDIGFMPTGKGFNPNNGLGAVYSMLWDPVAKLLYCGSVATNYNGIRVNGLTTLTSDGSLGN